jgi:hypothetical protein
MDHRDGDVWLGRSWTTRADAGLLPLMPKMNRACDGLLGRQAFRAMRLGSAVLLFLGAACATRQVPALPDTELMAPLARAALSEWEAWGGIAVSGWPEERPAGTAATPERFARPWWDTGLLSPEALAWRACSRASDPPLPPS